MRSSWRHPAYLQKKSAVMERDGVDESVVEVLREIMPDCVLLLVRELYPNPVGVPYNNNNNNNVHLSCAYQRPERSHDTY